MKARLIFKGNKVEALKYFLQGIEYKQIGLYVHIWYYSKAYAKDDIAYARSHGYVIKDYDLIKC